MVTSGQNSRKDARREYDRPAWIDIGKGAALLLCMVHDISDTGVGMTLATDDALPPKFTLLFTRSGQLGRCCRVVWQDGHRLGCEFVERKPFSKRKLVG